MSYVPLVLGIKPAYPIGRCSDIEIIYKSGNNRMRLEFIPIDEAKHEIEKHGMSWEAYLWRYMDGLSDWEPVTAIRARGQE